MNNQTSIADLVYSITNPENDEEITKLGRALSSKDRLQILRVLQKKPMNLLEISKTLNLPISSVSFHINALEAAKIIRFEYQPVLKGHIKLCYKNVLGMRIDFSDETETDNTLEQKVEMPVGNYTEANVTECYLVGTEGFIFRENDYFAKLFTPERIHGQLFSFQLGSVSYNFPNLYRLYSDYNRISFSFEFCSEAPYYHLNWPSEITVWINDVEIATFLSPSDFGGRKGKYTPDFWIVNATQYGLLKTFSVDETGSYIDEHIKNKAVTFGDLHLDKKDFIKLTIGIKKDAKHQGGINIFGEKFGDYPQGIIMSLAKK